MTSFRPFSNKLAVRPHRETEAVSAGGIIKPDVAREEPQQGEIIAVGPEVQGLTVGMRVLYPKYAGVQTTINNEELLVFSQEDLLGELHDE